MTMAGRIRSIKPEILDDAKTANLSHLEWRLFVSSFLLADDHGNLRGDLEYVIGSSLWASRDCREISREDLRESVAKALETLARVSLLAPYSVRGQTYFHISGWDKHQKVDKPGKPRMPRPGDVDALVLTWDSLFRETLANDSREPSREPSRTFSRTLETDLRSPTSDPDPEREPARARAIPRSTQPPPLAYDGTSPGALSPDPRIRINHDAWAYAALKHAELRREGIDPGAVPWPPMPAGIAKDDLVARTKELTPNTPLDGSDIEHAASTHVRRVDVAVAEARREKHLRWFTPSRFYTAESFWRAAELTPEQAAQRYANRTNTSNGATGEPRIVLPAVDDDIPMNNPYESITSKL